MRSCVAPVMQVTWNQEKLPISGVEVQRQLAEGRRMRSAASVDFQASDASKFWMLHTLNSFIPRVSHLAYFFSALAQSSAIFLVLIAVFSVFRLQALERTHQRAQDGYLAFKKATRQALKGWFSLFLISLTLIVLTGFIQREDWTVLLGLIVAFLLLLRLVFLLAKTRAYIHDSL